jgi:hypothetical protein
LALRVCFIAVGNTGNKRAALGMKSSGIFPPGIKSGFASMLTSASIVVLSMTVLAQATVLLNFDAATQLDSLAATSPSSPTLTWDGVVGVGGSGGVTTSAGATSGSFLYSAGHFDATQTGVGFTFSYYFKTPQTLPTSLGAGIAGIGLAKDVSTDLKGGAFADRITLHVIKSNGSKGWGFATNNSTDSNSISGDFSIFPETWYKLEAVFTQDANGQWTIQMELWSYGSDGVGTPVSIASILRGASVHTAYSGVGSSTDARVGIITSGADRTGAFDMLESDITFLPGSGAN